MRFSSASAQSRCTNVSLCRFRGTAARLRLNFQAQECRSGPQNTSLVFCEVQCDPFHPEHLVCRRSPLELTVSWLRVSSWQGSAWSSLQPQPRGNFQHLCRLRPTKKGIAGTENESWQQVPRLLGHSALQTLRKHTPRLLFHPQGFSIYQCPLPWVWTHAQLCLRQRNSKENFPLGVVNIDLLSMEIYYQCISITAKPSTMGKGSICQLRDFLCKA